MTELDLILRSLAMRMDSINNISTIIKDDDNRTGSLFLEIYRSSIIDNKVSMVSDRLCKVFISKVPKLSMVVYAINTEYQNIICRASRTNNMIIDLSDPKQLENFIDNIEACGKYNSLLSQIYP